MPEVYDQFVEIATRLENYFRDMQDMEFTIEDGHLYMLQTRNGKRTAQAALQIACDLVDASPVRCCCPEGCRGRRQGSGSFSRFRLRPDRLHC